MCQRVSVKMSQETNGNMEPVTKEEPQKAPKTTTISTIAVQSGKTRLVIALLQVRLPF